MRTIQQTVYTFDELSEKAKEKAIQKQRDFEEEFGLPSLLREYLYDTLKQQLKKYDMSCDKPKIYYSLNYCQGDGAMFEGTVTYKNYVATITHSGRYTHYNSKDIELLTIKGNEVSSHKQEEFDALYVTICKELERAGYAFIEDYLTDESMAEDIRANEYEFYEDGTQA